MKRTLVWMMLATLCSHATAAAPGLMDRAKDMASGPLAGMLESQLGVNEDQAEGGIGSLLSLAKSQLSGGDFEKLAGSIPGADGYIESAKQLGAVAGPLTSLTDLNAALGRLGIPPETIEKFVPMATDLVGQVGGEQARQLLSSALAAASG
jgi:hypothetical protein